MSAGSNSLPLDVATLDAVQALEATPSRDTYEAATEALYRWRRSLNYGRPWRQREIDEARAIEALSARIDAAGERLAA